MFLKTYNSLNRFDFIFRVSVRLGEFDLNKKRDCQNGVCANAAIDVPIKEILEHNGYAADSIDHQHDIALLLLNRSVEMTKWIKPICLPLPKMSEFLKENFEHISMNVAGWGYTSNLPNGNCFFLQNFMIFSVINITSSSSCSRSK